MTKTISSLLFVACFLTSPQLNAGPVTWDFTGAVIDPINDSRFIDDYFDKNTHVRTGDRVAGSISWNPDVDFMTLNDGLGTGGFLEYASEKQQVNVNFTFDTEAGPESFSFSRMLAPYNYHNWLLEDGMIGTPAGTYDVFNLIDTKGPFSFYFRLVAPAQFDILPRGGFSPTPPDLGQLQTGRLNLMYEDPNTGEFDSSYVEFDSLVAVPEPSTISTAIMGLLILIGVRSKRIARSCNSITLR